MFSPILSELMHPVRAELISQLKRSDGMAVREIADALEMSYMGVKQHCEKLEKLGFIKTWRVPRVEAGRPQKLYQLTEKCDPLFPRNVPELTLGLLKAADEALGNSAAEKILFTYFRRLREEWLSDILKGKSLVEKATRLTALRQKLGIFSRCKFDPTYGFRIKEYHHPLQEIFDAYPNAEGMELRMMEELLGTKVTRATVELANSAKVTVLEVRTMGR